MGIFDDGYQQSIIDAARQPIDRPPAGFMEGFSASYDTTRQEDLSISERQNYLDKVKQRNEKILELTGKPFTATANPTDPGLTTVEKARLSAERQIRELSNQHPEIKNDDDILKEIIEDSKRFREKSETVTSNSTFAGKVGSFTGAMAATLTDPLVIGTIPFGASASAGILRTALIEAGYGMLSEAMIQPFVYRYKKTLNSPYDVSDALTRIGAAGVGSAALAGTIKGAAKAFGHFTRPRLEGVDDILEAFEKTIGEPTTAQKDAAHVLGEYADVMRENPFGLDHPLADQIHLEATAKAIADLDAGQPVDVRDTIRGMRDVIPESAMSEKEFNTLLYGLPETLPRTIGGATRQAVPTENQALSLFIRNHGGVSIEQAGALRGEYEALFESGGRTSGAVKRHAGRSPDELAQLAHESGFIDEPDPALLKEALERDLSGEKVHSTHGDFFERKMDLEIEREFQRWAEAAEAIYFDELNAKAKAILDTEDIQLPTGELIDSGGSLMPITRSAKEFLAEMDGDTKAGDVIMNCMLRG